MLEAITVIEQSQTEKPDQAALKAKLQEIDRVTPDTADFGRANYAVNASGAIYETIEFILDRKAEHIHNIGNYLIDTVDAKLQGADDLSENEIDKHPLMVETKKYLLAETRLRSTT